MKTYKQYITEAGAGAGTHELVKTPLDKARKYSEQAFSKNGKSLDAEIPNFDENYQRVQSEATMGHTSRKDMPVIDAKDVKDLQHKLAHGFIDINAPFSDETNLTDPFPKGLAGGHATSWLEAGLKVHDGDRRDDKVSVKEKKVKISSLIPIQHQIYFDKSINQIAKVGSKVSESFITAKSTFIISSDNRIIDGHHRWLSGNLINPDMMVKVLEIDLPISQLLPLTLSYSDAVGNKRNA